MHIELAFKIYQAVLLFIFGTIFGSFINCQAYRIVHQEKWWTGRSHCATCNHPLNGLDLIPILSYLFLHGKCRYCGEKISPRYMLTELWMGIAFVGLFLSNSNTNMELLRDLGLTCVLLGISLVDWETMEIPDGYILFGIFWWLLTNTGKLGIKWWAMDRKGGMRAASVYILKTMGKSFLAAIAIAGIILLLSLVMDRILGKESMGGGDIKMLFMTTLYLGIWNGLFALILSCVIGLLFVAFCKQKKIPFGPSIAIATYLGLTIGPFFTRWYLSML